LLIQKKNQYYQRKCWKFRKWQEKLVDILWILNQKIVIVFSLYSRSEWMHYIQITKDVQARDWFSFQFSCLYRVWFFFAYFCLLQLFSGEISGTSHMSTSTSFTANFGSSTQITTFSLTERTLLNMGTILLHIGLLIEFFPRSVCIFHLC
jgi:hypothetical protein